MALTEALQRLAADMVEVAYLTGSFTLSSGRQSNYYFDKYLFETQPSILRRLGPALAALVPPDTQKLACPELGAVLLGGAVSMELNLPLVIVRREAKDYGTSHLIEGKLSAGERVTVLEDVLTSGAQAIRCAAKVREAGAQVIHLVGVLDREEGAAAQLASADLPFSALFRTSDLPLPAS
ncbi:MAG: orotate phosphoribosyltransferase [Chloroflexota bacterium]